MAPSPRPEVRALLERLSDWLEEVPAELAAAPAVPEPPPDAADGVGLYRLVEEFTALRHEVKLQTKGVRDARDRVDEMGEALRAAADQFRSVAPREAEAAWEAGRPLAEALADLDEALRRTGRVIEQARAGVIDESARALEKAVADAFDRRKPGWLGRKRMASLRAEVEGAVARHALESRERFFDHLREGFSLVLKRLDRALKVERVQAIPCAGLPVDPERMTVVEVVDAPGASPGTVVDEVRRGYTWNGRVFRFAEVRAARGSVA